MTSSLITDRSSKGFDVFQDDRICTDPDVITNRHRAKDLGARSNIDVAADLWNAVALSAADRHLLKDETVYAYFRVWVNDNAIWMWNEQPAADL
jgi:hypothetical protein